MRFKITTIPPEGRNEYGNYYSSDRITKNVMRVTYNGNASTGGNQKKDPVVEPQDNVILFLGKTTLKYNGQDVAVSAQTQSIDVMGYINSKASDTYVGDLTNSAATNYGIVGMPESGMSITVTDNGTPNTKINITINENVSHRNGTIIIPCSVNKKPDDTPLGNDWEDWKLNDNLTLMLECQWEVSAVYENSYVLELSNEIAGINCDKDGNILAGATRPTCQAELYLGQGKVTGATYGFTTPPDKNATGISIDTTTGILTFGSNFKFDGTTLEVKITASVNGTTVYKIMSIVKQYPGVDGTPATTRWVVPSHNSITYNPNNGSISPSSITCKCMKQVGEDSPVEDTGTTIYYGYDTTNPLTRYSTAVTPDVSKSYLVFGIKNTAGEIYEIETIQIIKEGKDGSNGTDGSNGESVYRLDLSNDNAGINCDADGNILATAVRPKCTATLYYGSGKATGVTYNMSFSVSTEGVTINPSTGEITFGSNFNFGTTSTTTLEITVTAKINGVLYGSAIMTISRNYAGKNGTDGVDGTDGINGEDGVSIVWKGSSISHPANPQNGWAYYNTAQKKSFIYQDGSWYQMTVDGTDGQDGQDGSNGLSIVWKGDLASAPSNPQLNWCYRDTDNGKVYIYNGLAWELMVLDGSDGTDGADGADGLSVFITYHDNPITSTPATPTGDGTTNGWHTTATKAANWMSQKVAATATSGTWGAPIQICGADGQDGKDGKDGLNGADGVNGQDGKDGADGVSIVWKGSSITHPANPQNGWAYYNTAQKKSFIYQDGAWYQMTIDGTDGQDGQDGSNGLSIVWKGDLATAPANPKENWCYRDTDNGKVYIYNGLAWELMVLDGSDGADGANGEDGLSVFITYHDNAITSTPANPTGNGTTNGWHTNATKAANWMSQKVAASASEGTWGAPIQICGADGQDGTNGEDGADAVTYWMEFSATAFQVDKDNVANPNALTIQVMKQVGGETPVNVTPSTTADTIQIKYGFNTVIPTTAYTKNSAAIAINPTKNYITVQLYVNGTKYETETLLILHDGQDGSNGEDGAQGRQGPALRGPVDWKNQTTSRRWCNGTLTNASYPEDGEFIDIVVYDGVYYMCKTSYNGKGSETTAPSSTYWTATDKQYEFVSTNLLLADNAKINFTSSNELYLMDSDGNVTAGAAGGDSVNFWAGANEPENGTFKVYNNGTMEATKGKFGILEIGKDEWDDGALYGTHTQLDGTLNNISIQPQYFEMEAVDQDDGTIKESVRIAPYADPDKYDMDGVITVFTDSETHNGIFTSGMMEAEGYTKRLNSHKVFSLFSPVNNLEITFVTDTNYFTKSNGYWLWKGMYLNRTDTNTYPYVVKGSNGEWCFATSSTATSGIGTGIYTSSHIKQNNRLYIVI